MCASLIKLNTVSTKSCFLQKNVRKYTFILEYTIHFYRLDYLLIHDFFKNWKNIILETKITIQIEESNLNIDISSLQCTCVLIIIIILKNFALIFLNKRLVAKNEILFFIISKLSGHLVKTGTNLADLSTELTKNLFWIYTKMNTLNFIKNATVNSFKGV